MKKLSIFCLFFISILIFSQDIFEKYPEGQQDYEGGSVTLYKEINQILIDKNLKPCDNKNEYYAMDLLVYPDNSIKFVKDENSKNIAKNKCAFDLARSVAPALHHWKAATIDNQKVIAKTTFYLIPTQLFSNFKEGYSVMNNFTKAQFDGGINKFRSLVMQNFSFDKNVDNGTFNVIIGFTVDVEGKLLNVKIDKSSGSNQIDGIFVDAVRSVRNKWIPAKIQEFPISSKFYLPLTIRTSSSF